MSSLLDLPIELLILILERVGGRELRRGKGAARLAVCQIWYATALPIYLSGFGTSNVQLYGHNIEKLRGRFGYSGLRPLMHKNTRNLRIRLLGHSWDEATAQADEDGDHTTWNKSPYDMQEDPSLMSKALETWQAAQLRPSLDDLFGDLKHFEALESVVVEARAETVNEMVRIPHLDYIHADTISILVLNTPIAHGLVSFTLDTYGTELLGDGHVCDMIADVLLRIENVQLRMARLCPGILKDRHTKAEDMRLNSLVIKLHAPQSRSNARYGTTACPAMSEKIQLFDSLVRASQSFVDKLDAIMTSNSECNSKLRFRISHVPTTFPCVHVVDCVSMRQYRLRDEWFASEEDGKPCWFELEDIRMLVDCGHYIYCR